MVGFFARRYLFSRNARSVVNIIAAVSVAAVAVPVAAMIILLSVFNGFEGIIRQMRSSYDPDIAITPLRGTAFRMTDLSKQSIAGVEGVGSVSAIYEQSVVAGYRNQKAVALLRGVDSDYEQVLPVESTLVSGRFGVERGEDYDAAVPGLGLAGRLGMHSFVTDDMTLYAVQRGASFSSLLPVDVFSTLTLPVAAVFAIDAETDADNILTSLRAAQRLFERDDDEATALFVRVADGAQAKSVAKRLQSVAGDRFEVRTREQMNASLYRIIRYEKWGIFFIALAVLIVASLSIVGVLAIVIVEKRRDITTLRMLGADRRLIRSIFVAEGMLICGLGGAAGLVAGVAA